MAQYYTKQQLQGAGKYSGKVKIGNWNEDAELEEIVLKDYLDRKARGDLKLDKFQQRMAVALAPVETSTVSDEGLVHFGDVFCLRHAQTGALLAADVGDRDTRPGEGFKCAVSGSTLPSSSLPVARNTWLLSKYKGAPKGSVCERHYEGDVLHYGQKFRLVGNPMMVGREIEDLEEPLFLKSGPVTMQYFAKCSRHQEVSLSLTRNYSSVWYVAPLNPTERLAADGTPVPAGAPVILFHAATNEALCCNGLLFGNDFGKEMEVCCHNAAPQTTTGNLELTRKGVPEQLVAKTEGPGNHWVFEVGDTVRALRFRSPGESTARPALARLAAAFEAAGEDAVKALIQTLEMLDKSSSGWLDRLEVLRILKTKIRADLSPRELEEIAKFAGWESATSANWRDLVGYALDG